MRIVLIDFNFFYYSIQLANALSQLGDVTLMLPDKTAIYRELVDERVRLHLFHMPRQRHPANIQLVRSLFKTLIEIKPQVVHLLSWHLWMNAALPFFPDMPRVSTIHDALMHPGSKPLLFRSWQWRYSDEIIVHAEIIKKQMVEVHQVTEDRVHVIPHGANTFYTAWGNKGVLELGNRILFFGRIWEYKGLRYLIEAEPLITSQVPDARIVIAGQGESFKKYERLMINRDHFIVHNYHIPDEMVARLFQEAGVVVLPYIEASQSGVVATAYAFGKPVVTTSVGGIPEVLEHGKTGFLVAPRDPSALAEAVVTLLKDQDLRREMGQRALQKAKLDLSWESIARKTIRVYQKAHENHLDHKPG